MGEFFDGDVLGFVVGEAEVVLRADECFFCFLEVVDRLIDFVDGGLEFFEGEVVVTGEGAFEGIQFLLKVGDVDTLGFHQGEFRLVLHGVHRGVAEEGDHRNEELRADDIHLGIAVRDIDDAGVVKLAFRFEQGDEDGVFTAFFATIFIEFLEKVLIPFFGGGGVALVFHLEHDRDDLVFVRVGIAKDVVTLAAALGVVVLFEIRFVESGGSQAVELGLAVLLQGLTDHFGGELRFHVAKALDGVVPILDLRLVAFFEGLLDEFFLQLKLQKVVLQDVAVFLDDLKRFLDREFLMQLVGFQFVFE